MRVFSSLLAVAAFALGVAAAAKTKAPKGFAYVDDGEFKVDGDSLVRFPGSASTYTCTFLIHITYRVHGV
jgi:endo-1,4-beta-mannosidase